MPTKIPCDKKQPTLTEIQNWLVAYMTEMMEVDEDEIDLSVPFDEYGLDSSMAVALIADLEDWLGRELDRTLIYDYPTLEKLAKQVSESYSSSRSILPQE